jgi:hypothetical protein
LGTAGGGHDDDIVINLFGTGILCVSWDRHCACAQCSHEDAIQTFHKHSLPLNLPPLVICPGILGKDHDLIALVSSA